MLIEPTLTVILCVVFSIGPFRLGGRDGIAALEDLQVMDAVLCSGDRDIIFDALSHREWLSIDVTGGSASSC